MTALSHLTTEERETLRVAVARHQMKLRPIMVEQHLRDLAALREAAHGVAAEVRPDHEHYEDPHDCALCRLFALLDLPGEREQMQEWAEIHARQERELWASRLRARVQRMNGSSEKGHAVAAAFLDLADELDGGEA